MGDCRGQALGYKMRTQAMRPPVHIYLIAAGLVAIGACLSKDPVDRGPRGEPDAGTSAALQPPDVSVPEQTPESEVAVRGNTVGSRVVIDSDAFDPLVVQVLPGGAFCRDVPLVANEVNTLLVYALGGDGRVSEPAVVDVTHDPAAAPPADGNCSGGTSTCAEVEICDNGRDDTCNGRIDFCDLTCSGCVPDSFSPNHEPVRVPQIQPGTYDLRICPCHDDWFAFRVDAGERIHVRAVFSHAEIDLDLTLHPAGPEGNGALAPVAESRTSSNVEEIEYVAPVTGLYYLRAFAFPEDAMGSGDYRLTIFE
jgi:hypothetical protein